MDEIRSLLRTDYLSFACKAINEETGVSLRAQPYIDCLASELRLLSEGETRRLLINLPPRHGKTLLCSCSLAAWELAHRPTTKILVLSYAEHVAKLIARSVRNILRSPWFKETFSTRLAVDNSAAMDFSTTAGGGLYADSFGGSVTGRGADLIIIDDPHDIKDAANVDALNLAIERFDTTIMSRRNNAMTSRIIVVAQRVHEADLSAHLLRQGLWRQLALPMVAIEATSYRTDYGTWNRQKGELLRPDAYDEKEVQFLKDNTHNPGFELLYQQDAENAPLPVITADCFGLYSGMIPPGTPCVMSIDTGMIGGQRNSYSVIQIWCPLGDQYVLVEQWRAQCAFSELVRKFRRLARRHQPSAILVEATANGPALISMMSDEDQARTVRITPKGSKIARLRRHIDKILSGRILLMNVAGLREVFTTELALLSQGGFTDQIDAATQFFDFMADEPQLAVRPIRSWGTVSSRGGDLRSFELGRTPASDSPYSGRGLSTSVGCVASRR